MIHFEHHISSIQFLSIQVEMNTELIAVRLMEIEFQTKHELDLRHGGLKSPMHHNS